MLGALQSGTPTSQVYNRCMGWAGLALQPHGARARNARPHVPRSG
jgi:hypothetical protein